MNNFGPGKKYFEYTGIQIDEYLNSTLDVKSRYLKKDDFSDVQNLHFDYYSMMRFSHQLNESCNKLWAAIELAYAIKKNRLCTEFTCNFSSGSLMPNLYYSALSALVSIMCGFGVISFRHGLTDKDYFFIRTTSGWKLYPRQTYITTILRKSIKGWHEEGIKTYQALTELGYELLPIDFEILNNLRKSRNKVQYYILGKTSMADFFGIDEFFKYLPFTLRLINDSFELLIYLHKDLKNMKSRFNNLTSNVYKLYELYGKDVSSLPDFCTKKSL
jgi:hypothetical protein